MSLSRSNDDPERGPAAGGAAFARREPGGDETRRDRLRVCIIDMNQGHVNQAMRCFRGLVDGFFGRVRTQNPTLVCEVVEVSPRDTQKPIPRDCDLYLGSGGPGSPFDGDHDPWFSDCARFLDEVAESSRGPAAQKKSLFGVCYTFEVLVRHFKVATMAVRDSRKFGVMPIYTTHEGQNHPLLGPFGDRLFAFEHRNWEAIDLDREHLATLGGMLLAQESRDGVSKGRAVLGLDLGCNIECVQFHPEADRAGMMSWVARPEQAEAFRATYGEDTYQAMLRTIDDPNRLAKTYAVVIPSYLVRRFNALAETRGWQPTAVPSDEDILASFLGDSDGRAPVSLTGTALGKLTAAASPNL